MGKILRNKTSYAGVIYREVLTNEKPDKTYYIRYKDNNGSTKEIKIGKYSEGIREAYCNQKRNEILTKLRLGELPPALTKNKKPTQNLLVDIAKQYFDSRKDSKSLQVDKGIFNKHIEPYFKDIDQIDKTSLTKWQKILENTTKKTTKNKSVGDKLSDKYIKNIQDLLITINKFALKNDLTKNDFGKYIVKPNIDNARERFLSVEEINKLYEYSKNEDFVLFLFFKIALNTGGRLATILNISVKDIDFAHKIITLKDFKNNTTYKTFLKDDLTELLTNYIESYSIKDKLFKTNFQRRLLDTLDLLFNKGLDTNDRKNKVVIHSLRHTFASHLAINGTPIFTIQKLMNHKDIRMTLRYAKLSPDSGRESIVGLNF